MHSHRVFVFKSPQGQNQQQAQAAALNKLKSYTDTEEPKLARWLYDTWNAQAGAIKYQELKSAILSGDLSLEYLKQWQQDYAMLVNEHLAPAWLDAMEAATDQLKAKYPDWVFDPNWPSVQKWVQDHGTSLVVEMTQVQHEAMKQLVQKAAFMGEFGPDELSRAIRPLVGMVPRESKAVLNYYEALRKDGMSIKKAQSQMANYAGRVHRHRAMRIARTELAFAFNRGIDAGMRQAQLEGLIGAVKKRWLTADDERVCEICGPLDGQLIGQDASFGLPGSEKFVGQHMLPPAHPHCRCTVIYEEVDGLQPAFPGTPVTEEDLEAMDQMAITQQEMLPNHVPPPPIVPNPGALTYGGKWAAGTGEIHIYTDPMGGKFLYKPAQTKAGGPAEYKAHIQEAASRLQHIVDPDSAVDVGTIRIKGKFGTIQSLHADPDPSNKLNLKAWQSSADKLAMPTVQELQREHVTDWLLGNFDAHGGNFVRKENWKIAGVDKEQAFRYLKDPKSWKMSIDYHPNASYGEDPPIYNKLFKRFANKTQDMDLQEVLPYIKRVEAIPNKEYREMFRAYAEDIYGEGSAAEEALDMIVERKVNLRETYREFYNELLKARTGKKAAFVFADEGAEIIKQPLAAQLMSKDALKKMTTPQLMDVAKSKKIPYYNNMNKTELITAIAEPDQAPMMSAQVRDRLKNAELARRGRATQRVHEEMPDIIDADVLFNNFSAVNDRVIGHAVFSDRSMVEGLNLTARRMDIGGDEVVEITGKMTNLEWQRVKSQLFKGPGITDDFLSFEQSNIDFKKKEARFLRNSRISGIENQIHTKKYSKDGVEIHLVSDENYTGWNGFFRIRVKASGNGSADALKARKALEKLGIDDITKTPDAASRENMKKMRLVWQHAPERVREIYRADAGQRQAVIDKILKEEKIDIKRLSRMKETKVFDGYSTLVEEGISKEYEKNGAAYIFSGVRKVEGVSAMLEGPGMMATNVRYKAGIPLVGSSPLSDMRTGGSDSVFTRLVTKGAIKDGHHYNESYCGGPYRMIIDLKQLERTDWYAYGYDNFGEATYHAMNKREKAIDFVAKMNSGYNSSNEIMFRHGIPKEAFKEIVCENDNARDSLLRYLKERGINNVNSTPIDRFVKVRSQL